MFSINKMIEDELIDNFHQIHNYRYSYLFFAKKRQHIICPIHGEFILTRTEHFNGIGCPSCVNSDIDIGLFRTKKLVKHFQNVHGDRYNYENVYISNSLNEYVDVVCFIHGKFSVRAWNHLQGTIQGNCIECNKIVSLGKRAITKEYNDNLIGKDKIISDRTNKFIKKFIQVHNNLYDYKLVKADTSDPIVDIICKIHGIFSQRAFDHARGCGCPQCYENKKKIIHTYTKEQFIENAIKKHGQIYDYSLVEYKGNAIKVEIICNRHGSFWQCPTNHIDCGSGCPRCRNRWRLQHKWLDSIGLPSGPEYRQVKLVNDGIANGKKKLVADGFDPLTNTIYEFFGDYHHGNPKFYIGDELHCYNKQKLSDIFTKTLSRLEYLYSRGYKIIYIWENQFNDKKSLGYEYKVGEPLILD